MNAEQKEVLWQIGCQLSGMSGTLTVVREMIGRIQNDRSDNEWTAQQANKFVTECMSLASHLAREVHDVRYEMARAQPGTYPGTELLDYEPDTIDLTSAESEGDQ